MCHAERAAMLYAPGPYSLALGLAEIPYLVFQSIVMVRHRLVGLLQVSSWVQCCSVCAEMQHAGRVCLQPVDLAPSPALPAIAPNRR